MFRFFRAIRRELVERGRLRRYSAYAIGELVLVVAGILIALQINNANEARLERQREARFLENIRTDLQVNIRELTRFIEVRSARIESAHRIIEYFDGKPLEDLADFNYHNIHVQTWQRFYQNDNTFQELVNSGNLGIISNEDIKNGLMDIKLMYEKMKGDEDHMRYDYEGFLYEPFFNTVDIAPMTENFTYRVTGGQAGSQPPLSREDIEALLGDVRFKNGFTLAIYMMSTINAQFVEMRARTEGLVEQIDRELGHRIE
jgi:hypothetical protein